MHRLFLLTIAACTAWASNVLAQEDWQAEWNATVLAAKGKTLSVAVQPFEANAATVQEFQKRFPEIDVRITQMAGHQFIPRVIAEQRGGIYIWDSWMGQVSNVVTLLEPFGGAELMDEFLILPGVKKAENWRAPRFMYAEGGDYAFIYSMPFENAVYGNARLLKGIEIDDPDDLFDPRLKRKIAIQSADRSAPGAVTLAALKVEKGVGGEQFVRRLLIEMEPVIYENVRQISNTIMRSEMAVVLGAGGIDAIPNCKLAGGCRDVVQLPIAKMYIPRAVVVLKNPPHPESTKVWVNWLLSKEGQEVYIREWAETNLGGGTSMRKDVAPAPGHEQPDANYENTGNSLVIGTAKTERIVSETIELYKALRNAR